MLKQWSNMSNKPFLKKKTLARGEVLTTSLPALATLAKGEKEKFSAFFIMSSILVKFFSNELFAPLFHFSGFIYVFCDLSLGFRWAAPVGSHIKITSWEKYMSDGNGHSEPNWPVASPHRNLQQIAPETAGDRESRFFVFGGNFCRVGCRLSR